MTRDPRLEKLRQMLQQRLADLKCGATDDLVERARIQEISSALRWVDHVERTTPPASSPAAGAVPGLEHILSVLERSREARRRPRWVLVATSLLPLATRLLVAICGATLINWTVLYDGHWLWSVAGIILLFVAIPRERDDD